MPPFHYDATGIAGCAQPAMVLVRSVGGGRYLAEANDSGMAFHICSEVLRPMPPTITPEQEAVLRAIMPWIIQIARDGYRLHPHGPLTGELIKAADAFRKSLAPVDPVAEVKAAWHELLRNKSFQHDAVGRMADAIAALEAKS